MSGGIVLSALLPGLGLHAASRAQITALCFDGNRLLAAGREILASDDEGQSWSKLHGLEEVWGHSL
tara:strand:+ start:6602 stop:6799 length:198 start_codon:yes stop_codon:yes gene_type:complete